MQYKNSGTQKIQHEKNGKHENSPIQKKWDMEIAKYKKRTKRKKQNMIRIQYLVSLLEKCQHQKSET